MNYIGCIVSQRGHSITQHEALFGTKPNVEHLRVLSCQVCVHVPMELQRMLAPRAVQKIFMRYGCGQKGCRVLVNSQIELDSHIRFDEAAASSAWGHGGTPGSRS